MKKLLSLLLTVGLLLSFPVYHGGVFAEDSYSKRLLATDEGVVFGSQADLDEQTGKVSFTSGVAQGKVTWYFTPEKTGIYEISSDGSSTINLSLKLGSDVIYTQKCTDVILVELEENTKYTIYLKTTSKSATVSYVDITYKNEAKDISSGENYEIVHNCGSSSLEYGNRYVKQNADIPAFTKIITVPYKANYSFYLKGGFETTIDAYVYIGTAEGGKVQLIPSDADADTQENILLFENVSLEPYKNYKVTIFNSTESSTLRIDDFVLRSSGEYQIVNDSISICGSYYSEGSGAYNHYSRVRSNSTDYKSLTYDLNIAPGNYKVTTYVTQYNGEPKHDIHMSVGTISEDTVSYSVAYNHRGEDKTPSSGYIDWGTINVTDGKFKLLFKKTELDAKNLGINLYDVNLERITEPDVTIHSLATTDEEITGLNTVSKLSAGILSAKAYLPASIMGEKVTVLFAIYDGEGSLYKVEKETVDSASVNQVVNVKLENIEFEEGKTYTSKVFFFDDTVNIHPYYPTAGILTGAVEVAEG